jgi:acetyl esterase/lipase
MPGPETALPGGVTNVSRPTITFYPPLTNPTGTAVVVIPGGGFQVLAMGLEGAEVCDWLTSRGVACVLLKYRVPSIPYVWQCKCRPHNKALSTPSLQDVQRAIRLVRAHAKDWRIDQRKVGVIGFSAGGYLVAEASTYFDQRLYPPQDAADALSARPDFAMAIYPGHLAMAKGSDALNPTIGDHISARVPPTFLVQAEDDHVDRVEDSRSYARGLQKAGVPVELHTFASGGHAFGLRAKGPIGQWPQLAEQWMRRMGMLPPGSGRTRPPPRNLSPV